MLGRLRTHLGRTGANHIWKEKLHSGQTFEEHNVWVEVQSWPAGGNGCEGKVVHFGKTSEGEGK